MALVATRLRRPPALAQLLLTLQHAVEKDGDVDGQLTRSEFDSLRLPWEVTPSGARRTVQAFAAAAEAHAAGGVHSSLAAASGGSSPRRGSLVGLAVPAPTLTRMLSVAADATVATADGHLRDTLTAGTPEARAVEAASLRALVAGLFCAGSDGSRVDYVAALLHLAADPRAAPDAAVTGLAGGAGGGASARPGSLSAHAPSSPSGAGGGSGGAGGGSSSSSGGMYHFHAEHTGSHGGGFYRHADHPALAAAHRRLSAVSQVHQESAAAAAVAAAAAASLAAGAAGGEPLGYGDGSPSGSGAVTPLTARLLAAQAASGSVSPHASRHGAGASLPRLHAGQHHQQQQQREADALDATLAAAERAPGAADTLHAAAAGGHPIIMTTSPFATGAGSAGAATSPRPWSISRRSPGGAWEGKHDDHHHHHDGHHGGGRGAFEGKHHDERDDGGYGDDDDDSTHGARRAAAMCAAAATLVPADAHAARLRLAGLAKAAAVASSYLILYQALTAPSAAAASAAGSSSSSRARSPSGAHGAQSSVAALRAGVRPKDASERLATAAIRVGAIFTDAATRDPLALSVSPGAASMLIRHLVQRLPAPERAGLAAAAAAAVAVNDSPAARACTVGQLLMLHIVHAEDAPPALAHHLSGLRAVLAAMVQQCVLSNPCAPLAFGL